MTDKEKIEVNARVIENIYSICKLKDIKIGTIERQLGVQIGYFARKKNYQAPLHFTDIYEVVKIVGVTINDLVYKNFAIDLISKELEGLEQQKAALLQRKSEELEKEKLMLDKL